MLQTVVLFGIKLVFRVRVCAFEYQAEPHLVCALGAFTRHYESSYVFLYLYVHTFILSAFTFRL